MEGLETLVGLVWVVLTIVAWVAWVVLPIVASVPPGNESGVEAEVEADGPSWPEEPSELEEPAEVPAEPAEPVAGLDFGELSHRTDGCCGICGTLVREDIVRCETCFTPHHGTCWHYTGGCSIYGCESRTILNEAGRICPRPGLLHSLTGARGGREWSYSKMPAYFSDRTLLDLNRLSPIERGIPRRDGF